MNTVSVIAAHGRLPLLEQTIRRLYNKNKVAKVVCVAGKDEEAVIKYSGAVFVEHENQPLGKKWNAGFIKAKEFNPDACLFVGSSDWLSDTWLEYIEPNIGKYDIIGKPDFYLLDIGDTYRLCHWHGYVGERSGEPIGIGRVLSSRILNSIDWKPFDDGLNKSLDFSMYNKCLSAGGKNLLLKEDRMMSLSISTNKWGNMHNFERHWIGALPSVKVQDHSFLIKNFPEAFQIFK